MSGGPESSLKTAFGLHRAGDLATAARLYRDILRADPENADALYLLGFVHFQRGEFSEAERLMAGASRANPRSLDAVKHRGLALLKLERREEALACFDRALAMAPGIFELHLHRASALAGLQRYREAEASYRQALALEPRSAEAWNNLGNVLLELRRNSEALASFEKAAALKPESPQVWNNRGNALAELGRFGEAVESYGRSLALAPGDAGVLNHRAIALFEGKRYADAARDFAAALELDPGLAYARGNLIHSRLHCCDWTGFEEQRAEVLARLARDERVVTPIEACVLSHSPDEQLRASRIWAEDRYKAAAEPLWRGERYRHERIRVAYLSADFHSHATAALMAGVFEQHDRNRFQVHAISYGPDDGSEMRARLLRAFERFEDVRERSNAEAAELLERLEIDIAVDLKGHTQEARPGILSFRAAPVQAHYLGFPGTMGAPYVDYILADRIVVPEADRDRYAEKVVYLPGSYQCNDSERRISRAPQSRAAAGLPEAGFVFCSFNNSYKIAPEAFAVWMRLLRSVEGSVLWLLADNPLAVENLQREAEARGVARARLVFAGRVNLDAHLARHRLADLFLDTLPYGAHTTASDALWAGLPVLTRLGATFAGRVAASLLRAAGLPELVMQSWEEYEALALELAGNPGNLAALKTKLAENRDTWPLFDTGRFTRHLEAAYTTMWERAQRGEPPASFAVAPQT